MHVGKKSMSLISVGRLFQTSEPLTENARWPNCVLVRRTTADLVVDDHSSRWCALGLNATKSIIKKWMNNCVRSYLLSWAQLRKQLMFIKFIFDVWENKIVPTLSKMHGARWPAFWQRRDGKDDVVQSSCGEIVYIELSRLSWPSHMCRMWSPFNWLFWVLASTCPYSPQSSSQSTLAKHIKFWETDRQTRVNLSQS